MTATFVDLGNRSELIVRMLFESAEGRDRAARELGAVEGLEQTLERLEEHVTTM